MIDFAASGKGSTSVLCDHFYVFSRMVLQDPEVFSQLMTATAGVRSEPVDNLFDRLMDQWWRNFDSMAEPRHRKLTAMAMACLPLTGNAEVLKRLPTEISNVWLDVLGEIKEAESEDPDNPSPLHTYWNTDGGSPPTYWMRGCEDTREEERRKTAWTQDPVQSVKLTSFINTRLKEVAAKMGQENFEAVFVQKLDEAVFKQLMDAFAS